MAVGTRVLRGPDWNQNEDDGGEGHLGTVVEVKAEEGTAEVVWDNGRVTTCRVGKDGKHDLRILDNAQAGVSQRRFSCDSCKKDIFGMRWRCTVCVDFDLCTLCYVMNMHDLSHAFNRFIKHGAEGVRVDARQSSTRRVRLAGIFPGARVTRGRDWLAANADGGEGGVGTVVEMVSPESGSARNAVRVSWDSGQSLQHRLGLHGKVDLVLNKVSPAAPPVYIDHLPVLELERTADAADGTEICVGAKVKVDIDLDLFRTAQTGRSGWTSGLAKCVGKTGVVKKVAQNGDVEVDFEGQRWRINPVALKRGEVVRYSVGDKVRVLDNMERVQTLQDGHGGWVSEMRNCIGKVGRVTRVDHDGDLRVDFGGRKWTLSPLCCRPDPDGEMENPADELTGLFGDLQQHMAQLAGLTGMTGLEGLGALGGLGGLGGLLGLREALKTRVAGEDDLPPNAKKFVKAIMTGDVGKVKAMLDSEPELMQQKVQGLLPLHVAADSGEAGVAALLLDRGADINQGDRDEDTPLILAVNKNRRSVMDLLLERGADVNRANENGRTALHKAANRGRAEICRLLLVHGANVNRKDVRGNTPLFGAMETADEVETVEVLLTSSDIDFTLINRKTFNLAHFAAFRGRPKCMAKLLARDRSLVEGLTEDERWTPLHVAAVNDHSEDLKLLVQAGGDINKKNINGITALHLACKEVYIDSVMTCVESGADLDNQDNDKWTPLHRALDSTSGNRNEDSCLQVANYLIQQGARTDLRNNRGQTPLELASDSLRARVEAFIRECVPTARQPPISTKFTTSSSAPVPEIPRREPNVDKRTNEQPAQQIRHTVMGPSKCLKCSVNEINVIFLPCAHKVLCQSCATSVSACPQCQKPVKRKIDIRGNIVS